MRATSRAAARFCGVPVAAFSRAASQYRYGSSKRPSSCLTRRTRRTASSTSFTSTRARLHERREVLHVGPRLHVHVAARGERDLRRVLEVLGVAVRDHLADRAPVGDDEPREAPLALQDVALQVRVPGRRDAADLVERVHERGDAGVGGRLERRQDHVAQRLLGDVDRVVVAAGLGEAVGRVVLGAGRDRVHRREVLALEADDARPRRRRRRGTGPRPSLP